MRKVTLIRHGKANKAAEGQADIDRVLSEVGIQQATDRHDKMNGTKFHRVISSPAPRASMTGEKVAGVSSDEIVIVDALYPDPKDGGVGTQIDVLFNLPHLGYAPVSKYLSEEGGDAVMQWAANTVPLIEAEIGAEDEHVAIFGHAVCLPAIGMAICEGNKALVEQIAEIDLGECQGFTIVYDASEKPVAVEMITD